MKPRKPKARLWNRCEVRAGGCKKKVDYLVDIISKTKKFIPRARRLLVCDHCYSQVRDCGLATVTIMVNLIELKKELV